MLSIDYLRSGTSKTGTAGGGASGGGIVPGFSPPNFPVMPTLGGAMSRGLAIAGIAISGMAMVGEEDIFPGVFCEGMEGGARIRGIGVLSDRAAPGIVGPATSGVVEWTHH